jgi:MarR family transcriptional regulator, negative regulator of the multidrug operon emrRAB
MTPYAQYVSGARDARLTNLVGALSLAIVDHMRTANEDAAGMTAAAPAALVALHEFMDRGTVDQLHLVTGLTPSGAVRLVDRLVADGYVERKPGRDGRSVALALTPRGRRVARRVRRARSAAIEEMLVDLSAADRASLSRLIEKMVGTVVRSRLAGDEAAGGWLCRLCDFEACGRPMGRCPAQQTAAELI